LNLKRIVLILFLSVSILAVKGQEPSEDLLRKVAGAFLTQIFPGSNYEISGIRAVYSDSIKTMFVIDLSPEGWILLSGDEGAVPVIGFSFTGKYSVPDKTTDNSQNAFIDQYSKQIKAIKYLKSASKNTGWQVFTKSATASMSSQTDTWVFPIIKVNWDQGSQWNRFCPIDPAGPGGHVYVGCVAVAMSQAMSAFKKPVTGQGTNTYTPPGYTIQYVDFGAASYKWDSMSLSSADNYNALLLYHTAVSVNMQFSASASGSYMTDASVALKKYFNYSRHVTYRSRLTNDQDWMNLLNSELLKGRPIMYAADADNGTAGHAFNIDGVINGYYHLNWGWNGADNGYFTINSLRPGSNDFTKNHAAIIGIQPFYYPTDVTLSDTVVKLNIPAGKAIGKVTVIDEATNNVYTIKIISDSSFNGTNWLQDYYLDGDSLRTNRVFTETDPKTDTVRFFVNDIYGNSINKNIALKIGASSTGINLPWYNGEQYVLLYPNPATDYIYINGKAGTEITSLTIYSLSGALMGRFENPAPGSRIAVNFFPAGIYIYEAKLRDRSVIRGKIIIR
jgi:hypothetical protein